MITSIFGKSRPLNYILLSVAVALSYVAYIILSKETSLDFRNILQHNALIGIIIFSLFVVNFIAKKNNITRDNSYVFLFYLCFLLFFPGIFLQPKLIISSFFILLATRRLMSLHSLIAVKEKIFDASLWIFVAALFHFWSILFVVLVFVSIIFHASSDYRNWILPFISFFTVLILFTSFSLVFDKTLLTSFFDKINFDIVFKLPVEAIQKLSLMVFTAFAIYLFVMLLLSYQKKPLILHHAYKKVIFLFLIGILVYLVSPQISNEMLVFTFFPLAIMATSFVETTSDKWSGEIMSGLLILFAVLFYIGSIRVL